MLHKIRIALLLLLLDIIILATCQELLERKFDESQCKSIKIMEEQMTHLRDENRKIKNMYHQELYMKDEEIKELNKQLSTTETTTGGMGKRFVIVFTSNYNSYPRILTDKYVQGLIVSREDGWYVVHAPYLNIHERRQMNAGINVFNLSHTTNPESFVIENKGIIVETSTPVTVYAFNYESVSVDGFNVIPEWALSTDYVVASTEPELLPPFLRRSEVAVIATVNDTVVNFTLSTEGSIVYENKQYGRGNNISVVLNQYETFQIDHIHDLTGTRIHSNQPIAVVSGNRCGDVKGNGCDHLNEMIPPVQNLGLEHIIPIFENCSDHLVKVIGIHNDTAITFGINGIITTHRRGVSESLEKFINEHSFVYVSVSNPSLVSLFVECDNDPFMVVVPDVNRYLSNYDFAVPYDGTSYVNIIIRSDYASSLRLDGKAISSACYISSTSYSNGQYCIIRSRVAPGSHTLYNIYRERFGLFVFGYNRSISFGYFAGMAFD